MANTPKKVAILGFDCAEPHLIKKHIAEGHLPAFKKLFEQGVLAENCLPPFPTITPPNWATIATGTWPGTHGVTDFHLHKEGSTHVNANIFEAFSSENCKAEFIWDRLDAANKKCIVCNYPGSWPSKMKNGIMVAGTGLGFSEVRNGLPGLDCYLPLGNDQLVTTGYYPWGTRVELKAAEGWQGLPADSEEPLAARFEVQFRANTIPMAPLFWHVLVTQSEDKGYDLATVCTSPDLKDALFTVERGEWSKKVFYKFRTQDGQEVEAFFKAKLQELSDDAEDFLLFISMFCPTEGWADPPEVAREIMSDEGIFTFASGLMGYALHIYEMETWGEIAELHDIWLGDVATQLMTKYPWDLFCMHCHTIDWIYHAVLTEMDEKTCTSKEVYEQAWAFHLRILQSQDRMLARIIEAAGDDTLFVLVSDHGAVADGPSFNPYIPLIKNGLCAMEGQADSSDPTSTVENIRRVADGFKQLFGDRQSQELAEMGTWNQVTQDISRSKALPQRTIYVYVNLKGRDPGGIVDPSDYEKVQQEIIDALYTYVDPDTGKRPISLALSKKDARILGLHGDGIGDVVYAVYPEFGGQHGPHLPTVEWGTGKLKALQAFCGPGIKKGVSLERTSGLTDVVPTVCHLMNWPLPTQVEGSILYQVFENPNFAAEQINNLRTSLARMENKLSGKDKG